MTGSRQIDFSKDVPERVVLVGFTGPERRVSEVQESLDELAQLTESANGFVVDKVIQNRSRIDPRTFIGKGKAIELAAAAQRLEADIFIFDDDLAPAQAYNLEKIIQKKIIDRTGLILDIFAQHARTREAKTQVELAQLNYLLPRLTGHWSHFSRQQGGIGLRGPGETQLETDRRLVRKRIIKLRAELSKIEKQRTTRSTGRKNIFKAALIGYTNAGKSTLMNALTKSDVLVEDKLFATLDSTVRKVQVSSRRYILLSDTVGFIKKLPHHLIASFHSTLGDVRDANLLLHVIDLSHPNFVEQIEAVNDVIRQLEIGKKTTLLVFNKIDKANAREKIQNVLSDYTEAIIISAEKGIGLRKLTEKMESFTTLGFQEFNACIPLEEEHVHMPALKRHFEIMETIYEDSVIQVKFRGNPKMVGKIKCSVEEVRFEEE